MRPDAGQRYQRPVRAETEMFKARLAGSWQPQDRLISGRSSETLSGAHLIILGIILLIIGFVAQVAIIWTIGIVVVVAGAVLALLGMAGHAVGGRRHYF
jgi:Flp pilus assembly protein TadB